MTRRKKPKSFSSCPKQETNPSTKRLSSRRLGSFSAVLGEELARKIHVCVYAAPFGVVPLELDEVYPLSQHEAALPLDLETVDYVASKQRSTLNAQPYAGVVLLNDPKLWQDTVKSAVAAACSAKGLPFESVDADAAKTKEILVRLSNILRKQLSE